VSAGEGIDPIEYFVLHESDGDALLWELAAGWTDNGTPEQRMEAAPLLRDAVTSLGARGFVEVRDFPSWPPDPAQAVLVTGAELDGALAGLQNWLWLEERTSLLTVSLTDTGIPYL
jgi:hypothetical protein